MITYRKTTRDDLLSFYGRTLPSTIRSITVEKDGEPIVIGGAAYEKTGIKMFMDMKPGAEKYPVAILKATRQIMAELVASGTRCMYAIADSRRDTATRFLEHIGFEYHGSTQHGEVWTWRTR